MCGVAGAFGPVPLSAERIDAALGTMAQRGPDASGHTTLKVNGNALSLLHTRLAIIDLDPRANQPYCRDHVTVTYNGEIYNYVELRHELRTLGHTFATESDTEVLVAAYLEWGADFHDRLEGMWSFALVDTRQNTLLLSRDRFGEKPLYTWFLNGTLYFASEIKTLAAMAGHKPDANTDHIRRFLVNGYKSLYKTAETYYRGIVEFPIGCAATLTVPAQPIPEKYWALPTQQSDMTLEHARTTARDLLIRSVEQRLRADVPIAFCLSGGIDSATLAGIAVKEMNQSIHCFSVIDEDERYNETENINAMVQHLGCDHHVVRTSKEGFFDRMRSLVAYHDAPVVTISYYMHSFLSEAIAENGYKIALSGTAADEIFTGYYDHYGMWLAEMHNQPNINFDDLVADWKSGMGAHVANPLLQDPLCFVDNPAQREHILLNRDLFSSFLISPFTEDWTEETYAPELLRNRMANELFHESIPVILHEDDRNSMMYSVENRSPFLDRSLVEFLYSVPTRHLMGDGFAKKLLRNLAADFVPDSVRFDARKRGFNASIMSLVDISAPETRDILMAESPIFEIVQRGALEDFLSSDLSSNSFSKFFFSFISAKLFLENHAAGGYST